MHMRAFVKAILTCLIIEVKVKMIREKYTYHSASRYNFHLAEMSGEQKFCLPIELTLCFV
jgi:hypothetical protein